jgi:hypothetical protein
MKTDQLMNNAKAAVNSRSAVLALKLLQTIHAGGSAKQVSEQLAQHIINTEWPAIAALVVDMDLAAGR